ncbi:DUF4270 family protein [Chryseobacterium profundimaris]|uniref:DUF4270 domain-containing protein n=1 Tax=Chryseobacterium profundimaris TaxID=1387275 RepID=A0ABY1PCP5_9FLAO|nr:DUF4270 family protein [Chryseobacterium profundimaris]SMP29279.1 protein of unknown function [Chryseobacterium profundimaris]
MIHTLKKTITSISMVVLGSVLLYNCEPDPDTLGEQLFLDGAAQGKEEAFSVVAYNIDNNDTIRTDAAKLTNGVLGAFNEGQFGLQKASYLTQVKLSTYDPDFGTNATVDSVVLVIKPKFASDSVTTNTVDDNYTYTTAADGAVNAKKVVNTYPVLKFGKAKRNLTIKVNEVQTFLKSASDTVKSNEVFAFDSNELGSKVFSGNASSIAITKDDGGTALFTASTPGIRIPLDKNFFQTKIIAKKDQPELQDASNFIRYFKGLRVSVAESDGYLFQFSPNDMEMVMYYKYDKTENGTTTRPQTSYSFVLGVGNAHIGQYQYERTGSAVESAGYNSVTGDAKLYAQAMGGNSIGIKIPEATITKLKNRVQVDKVGIISAKIRMYVDPTWKSTNYASPTEFTLLRRYIDPSSTNPTKVKSNFTNDLLKLAGVPGYAIFKAYDMDKEKPYYDFIVTQSIKEMIEPESKPSTDKTETKYFKIDLGSFERNADGTSLAGYKSTTSSYDTRRAVFIGTNATDPNRVELMVTYGTK